MKKLLSFRILLFVFFVVSMFSACNKTEIQGIEKSISKTQTVEKEALTSKEVSFDYAEINANLEEFAKALALQMANAEIRTLIKKEALKKFDGDYDILYKNFKDLTLATGKTVENKLVEKNAEISTKAAKIPKFQISVPVNCEKWDTESFTPLVAVAPQGVQEKDVRQIKAYNSKGELVWIDGQKAPSAVVIVVGINERTDDTGKLYEKYTTKTSKAPSNGRAEYSPEYLDRCYSSDPSNLENWWLGALEMRMILLGSRNGVDVTAVSYWYSIGRECIADQNGAGLADDGCGMGNFIFTWTPDYGNYMTYKWVEEDGGFSITIPITVVFALPPATATLNTSITIKNDDDEAGSAYSVYKQDPIGLRYGSSSVFNFCLKN